MPCAPLKNHIAQHTAARPREECPKDVSRGAFSMAILVRGWAKKGCWCADSVIVLRELQKIRWNSNVIVQTTSVNQQDVSPFGMIFVLARGTLWDVLL